MKRFPLVVLSPMLYLLPNYVQAEQSQQQTPTILIEETQLSDVSGEEIKSADLAEALTKKLPSISIIRRSGIANDIILRGQNKDNINILIDNGKIYGAGTNRMDPPTSHVLTNNIDSITVIEGPYDIENFGTLSGAVKITTKKPAEDFQGEISANLGRWSYRKMAANFSGGNEKVSALISLSKESSAQYEDGDGNNFAQQIKKISPPTMAQYKEKYHDLDAYDKKTFMGKIYFNLIENHQMSIGYTANRSDDVLYPSSIMDALYDDSNILNLDYRIKHLSRYSKKLEFQYYDSDVAHNMSTKYRQISQQNAANERMNNLTTRMQGFKIKNSFDINSSIEATIGFDTSLRNWDGKYIGYGMSNWISNRASIDDVDTKNTAVFAQLQKHYGQLTMITGARYDDTSIKPAGKQQDNDYSALSAFLRSSYQYSQSTKFILGFGKSSRVPDARELYFKLAGMNQNMMQPIVGTDDLNDTKNYEIDFIVDHNFKQLSVKTKFFHSWLKDYIYYNADKQQHNFENIDATLYGLDISGLYAYTDEIYIDFGLAYQRGKKNQALAGQTDRDLANITPLKINLGLNYDYSFNGVAKMEVVARDSWDNFDSDNGEQQLNAYAIFNLKIKHNLSKHFILATGLDNVFNKTYAVNNTYKDISLLIDGSGEVMLINEPGRYYYINGTYKF